MKVASCFPVSPKDSLFYKDWCDADNFEQAQQRRNEFCTYIPGLNPQSSTCIKEDALEETMVKTFTPKEFSEFCLAQKDCVFG